jgi:hypothetical protein
VDAGGNVYTVGRFVGETDFDPGPGTFILPPMGGDDAFVWKLDSNGNFVWATTAGNAATGVAVDAGGNVYSVGEFVGTVDFDPGPGTFDLTSAGSEDAFVWKLDSNGSFVWAQRLGTGSSSDFARGVALDTIGGVYVVGILREWFIVRLGIDGNLLWTQELGGTPEGVAADASGNVYSVGFFTGTADFDPGPGTFNLTSAGDFDAFVEKFGGAPVPAGNVGDTLRIQHAAAGDVTLSWSGSCATTDDDFAIYEGVIGSWYSHIARFCGTGGATTATFTPSAGDTYYLLVPRNAVREGSYGAASNGTLRPQPSNACTVQQIAQPCP